MKFTALALSGCILLPLAKGQCIDAGRQFELEFEGECNYENLLAAFETFYTDPVEGCTGNAQDELNSLLAGFPVDRLCTKAFQSYDYLPFADIAKKGGDFEQLFYNGGTDWNEEYQTNYPTDEDGNPTNRLRSHRGEIGDAARVNRVYHSDGLFGMIEFPDTLTNFDQCSTNALMCCWPKDRQANDNNGNCLDPYDKNCIDKDPADNTDLCYVDMEKGQLSTGFNSSGIQVFPNDDGNTNKKPSTDFAEGQVHCHGLAWAENPNDKSAVYKGNNLFYISMYDHLHQRGYVKNIPGAPMCACTDQMPIVSRSDCTQIDIEERFKFSYSKVFSAELTDIKIKFNACQGRNRNHQQQNNDLWSYMNRLFIDGKVGADKLAALSKVLVGDNPNNCKKVVDKMMHEEKGLSVGYVHDASAWTIVAGREGMDYTGNNKWATYGSQAVNALLENSPNKILRRVCARCVPQLQDIYYKRKTPIPEGYNLFHQIKNRRSTDENNVWRVDFDLYSTYEDAVNEKNPWDCEAAGGYRYDQGFPGDCSAYGRIQNQDTRFFDYPGGGKRDVAFYVERSEKFALLETQSYMIGYNPRHSATYLNPDKNVIYMTHSGTMHWRQRDDMNFLGTKFTGDVELIVNVANLEYSNLHTKSGLMIRNNLDEDSKYYGVMKTGDQGVRVQRRSSNGANVASHAEDKKELASSWLRLLKKFNTYESYKSTDGVNWNLIHTMTLDIENDEQEFYAGLFHYGKRDDRVPEVTFEEYSISSYMWPSQVPTMTPAPSQTIEWTQVAGKGDGFGMEAVTDAEFRAMLSSPPFLIRRICDSCKESHKDIYYKRLTELPPATELNFLDLFMNNWRSAPKNQLNVDFELYSSRADADKGINPWTTCNYNDGGVGFPRDCGPTGKVACQWNSYTRNICTRDGKNAGRHGFYVGILSEV